MASPEFRSVFTLCVDQNVTAGLREVSGLLGHQEPLPSTAASSSEDGRSRETATVGEVSDKMFCSTCQCPFESRDEQMEHYKLDWHRFNLRQRLEGRSAVTVDEFEKKTGTGDISSISGSDSDSEDGVLGDEVTPEETANTMDTDQSSYRLSTKVVFQNMQGEYLSLYRCVLQSKKDNEEDVVSSLLKISNNTIWVILMTGGGHFAGAVFKGKEILQHKTFHRYTVRAKRGTAQGLRDSQNRSHTPKSAGAALRRYNETALVKDIHDLLESWAEYLKEANAIFLRAPSYNKTIFLGGRGAPLDKKDRRVRVFPFATRRATFSEIQRVFDLLSTLHVYHKDTEISSILSPLKKASKKKTAKPVSQTIPEPNTSVPAETEDVEEGSSGEEDSGALETVEVTIGTLDLREHEVYLNKKKRRKRKEKREDTSNREITLKKADDESVEEGDLEGDVDSTETQRKSKSKRKPKDKKRQIEEDEVDESWEYSLRDALYTASKTGDIQTLRTLLQLPEDQEGKKEGGERTAQDNPTSDTSRVLCLLNKPIDSAGFTLLHVASAAAQKSVIRLLLDAGSDPANKDKKGQTPYCVAPEKDTRNTFRKYMAEHPHKYDYTKAQVPGPLTDEIESKKAEKKKAQKAARKQREKEQKEEKLKKQQEEEEKKRFTALSDREKRALAAERRLAEHVATTGVTLANIKRCFQCGKSLLGKIPFEYLDYSFCTPRCVQAHRKASAAARP
ncbi:ankyrin repeat and zinc finger domain-containing protein 1 isoform X2 [Myxocyprinus asiaticus]|nr:ankyrin repeat and zinc finger domain-containing protein 1 isoform X2 [Myxocyprinus asiaticus]XP_051564783.1 ankyrin repeat and zinc finger domain-containing protein 1 isoform X2 [Myxocyprinus asiaticus]